MALRQIFQFKSHTAFSLIGLVIGLLCVFIICAWSLQELRFDRFHQRSEDIYMVTTDIKDHTGDVIRYPETPPPLAGELLQQVPQIENAFHFLYLYGGRTLGREEQSFKESGIAATPEFLEVLNFRLSSGSASDLNDPNTIFLSRELAAKLFPEGDPLHREVLYKENQLLVVKGIFRNVPANSSLRFDFLIPYEIEYGISDEWWQLSDATFIRTTPSADVTKVHSLMKEIWSKRITDEQYDIGLISIADLRYGADFEFFNAEHGHGDRNKLFMFMGVAALILFLACLNYLNLISAHAVKRESEVWIRKVQGASSRHIGSFYVMESVILSVMAWAIATLFSVLVLPVCENLIGITISPHYLKLGIGLGLLASILLAGIASGYYPAIRAGSRALVESGDAILPGFRFRKQLLAAFVVIQFALSIGLVISSLIIFRQADFMRNFDTGYASENIVEFRLTGGSDSLRNEISSALRAVPEVESFSFAYRSPVNLTVLNSTEKWEWEGLEEGAYTSIYQIVVDEDYLNVFQIPVIEGRNFTSLDEDQGKIVINEKLAGIIGLQDPVGFRIRRGDEKYEIIGVVRDFNFQHLSSDIRPFLFFHKGSYRNLYVQLNTHAGAGLSKIQAILSTMNGSPVNYTYISEARDRLYQGEQQILTVVLFIALLCIALSSLGLYGIVSQSTATRAKEIAVRTVLGAGTRDLMISLNLNIIQMFLPGMFLGSFLAWGVMKKWLEFYSQRKEIEGWVFMLGPAVILVVALLSSASQTWKASRQSPAKALKYQ
jgi:ABC-type antimicrobial peptide transport system permease subunit